MESIMRTHLTICGTSESTGATSDEVGHYPATETDAESVVVAGAFESAPEVRAAWREQMGTPCPV